jgi:hypothetical protein
MRYDRTRYYQDKHFASRLPPRVGVPALAI